MGGFASQMKENFIGQKYGKVKLLETAQSNEK